ncbi:Bifunctional hemolysin/adenylate cyclase [Thalassocella blandensis]|nr:Bifunctional hemolysin/adenylate cyclase [Thalassocella blandensis]
MKDINETSSLLDDFQSQTSAGETVKPWKAWISSQDKAIPKSEVSANHVILQPVESNNFSARDSVSGGDSIYNDPMGTPLWMTSTESFEYSLSNQTSNLDSTVTPLFLREIIDINLIHALEVDIKFDVNFVNINDFAFGLKPGFNSSIPGLQNSDSSFFEFTDFNASSIEIDAANDLPADGDGSDQSGVDNSEAPVQSSSTSNTTSGSSASAGGGPAPGNNAGGDGEASGSSNSQSGGSGSGVTANGPDASGPDVVAPGGETGGASQVFTPVLVNTETSNNNQFTIDVFGNGTPNGEFNLVSSNVLAGEGTVSVEDNLLLFTPSDSFISLGEGETSQVQIEYTVVSDSGELQTEQVFVTLNGQNDLPVLVNDTADIDQNSTLTIDVLSNDSDPDVTDSLSILSADVVNGSGSVSVVDNQLQFNSEDSYRSLANGETATVEIRYVAQDTSGALSSGEAIVQVVGTNDQPVATLDQVAVAGKDSTVIDVLSNDVDPDNGDVLTISNASITDGEGSVTIVDGHLVYQANDSYDALGEGQSQQVSISYEISDSSGATSTSTAIVTLTGSNDGPIAVADFADTFQATDLEIDVLANDTDVDVGDELSITSVTVVEGSGAVSVVDNTVHYNPEDAYNYLAEGETATVVLQYTARDLAGEESVSTVTVEVTGTNDGPVASADVSNVFADSNTTIDVLANDSDADISDSLTIQSAQITNGSGLLEIVDNKLVYSTDGQYDDLESGQTSQVEVVYTVVDDTGATSEASVFITVTGTDSQPIAVADVASTDQNTSVEIDVLANDSGSNLTLESVELSSGSGTVSIVDNKVVFDADGQYDYLADGETEQVELSYTVANSNGETSSATISLTVTGTNDGPVANPDIANSNQNDILTLDVLLNDSDPDGGDVLTLSNVEISNGSGLVSIQDNKLVFDANGAYDYLADGESEQVDITYTITDASGETSSSSVTLTVSGSNDAPIAVTETVSTDQDSAVHLNVLANDIDPDDGETLTITDAAIINGFGQVNIVDNDIVFDPASFYDALGVGESAEVEIQYTVTDSHGEQSTVVSTVNVTGTNDGPIASADSGESYSDSSVTIDVLANDIDPDANDSLTLSQVNIVSGNGLVSIVDNKLVYQADGQYDALGNGETETVTVEYTVQDGSGSQSVAVATITVTGTDGSPIAVADTGSMEQNDSLTLDVLANDSGDNIALDSVSLVSGNGSVSIDGNNLVYQTDGQYNSLAAGETAEVEISYTIINDDGLTSSSTVSVTVTGTNDGPVAIADTATTDQDTSVTIDVLANDTDADAGDTLTLNNVSVSTGTGLVSIVDNKLVYDANGTYDSLANGETAEVEVSYTVVDSEGASSTSTVTLTVTGTNDGPVAVADTAVTDQDTSVTVDVLANDTDADAGDTLTLNNVSISTGTGLVSIVDNKLVYDANGTYDSLANGETAEVEVSYTVVDSEGASSTSTATITVTGTNDGPVAVVDTAATDQDTSVTVDVIANDTDADSGDSLTLNNVSISAGTGLVSIVDNKLVYDANGTYDSLANGETAEVVVSYSVVDSEGASSTSSVTLTVTGTNDGPVAVADTATTDQDTSVTVDVLGNDTDADAGDTLTLSNVSISTGTGLVSIVDNKLVYDANGTFDLLANGETAEVVVSYSVVDSEGASSTSSVTLTVTGTNDGPVAVADTATTDQDTSVTVDVIANDADADAGDTLTLNNVSISTGTGLVSIVDNKLVYDANGTYDSLANGETAEVEVSYIVVDSEGASSTSTTTITVTGTNDGPVAVADVAATDQNTSVTVDVVANDTDADSGDTLTLNNVSISTGTGLVSIVDNKLVYDANGTYDSLANGETAEVVVSYSVVDSEGASSTSSVTLTVTGTNDGPVAVADTAATDQDTSVTVDVIANDTDADAGDSLTLNNVSISTGTGLVSIVDNKLVYDANGTYDSLANGETAEVVVSYSVVDSEGVSSTSTATITVTGTNDGPVAVADTSATDQDTSVTVDVIANDDDADTGDSLTLNNVSISTGTGLVSIVDNKLVYDANGTYDSLANGETAEVVVSYSVVDSEGVSSTSTATITVTGTNDGPVAVADTAATDQDTSVTVDVIANDTDADAGDSLTLNNVSISMGTGLVSIVDNKLVYDANGTYDSLANGETAEVEVSYTVVDSEGASSTSTATIMVSGTNDGPVAVADTAATDQDTSVTVDVVANDTDADTGDSLTLNNVSISTGTGLVSIVDNKLVYDANGTYDSLANGETAEVEVSYTVVDSEGASSTSTTTITVTGTNDGPVAVADVAATDQDTSVTVDVIANDTDADAGDTLTLNNVSISTGTGLVSIVDNKLVYDANGTYDSLANGETAEVVVSYSVVDSEGVSSTSTVTFTVTGTNDGPVAVADTATTDQDTSVTVDVIANDTDADAGDLLTLNNVSISTGTGLVSIVDNKLVYDANGTYDSLANGETAEVEVSYTVVDSEGASSTSTATLTVSGTNDGPVAVADTATTDQDTSVTVDVVANDTDADTGDSLTLNNVSISTGAGLVSIVDNKLVYDANGTYDSLANGETAEVEVSYTVVDSEGVSSTSTATITVTGTNDGPVAVADTAATDQDTSVTVDVIANDTDADTGDSLILNNASISTGTGLVSIVDNKLVYDANGTYDSLANGETAEVEVSYTVVDSEGASSTSTTTITVTGTNDGPVAVADVAATDQNTSVTVDVVANDTDADSGDTLTLNNVSISTGTGLVSIVDNKLVYDANGTYDSLASGETAEVVVSYSAVDSEGVSSTSTVTLTVTGTNDGPVAVANTATTDQDTSVTVDVIANDTDADAGDTLTLNNVSISTGTGLVSIVDNKLVYDANGTYDSLANGETAEVEVSYTVVDSEGASSTSTATITVSGTNDGPVAVADTAATDQDTSVTVDVVANDTDADTGDSLTLNNVSISTGTGLVSIVDNKLVYDANGTYDSLANGETAEVEVSYTVIDSEGASSTSTATITVTGTNDGPVAVADTATTDQDTSVTVDVIANDTDADTGDSLTLNNVSISTGTGLVSIVDNKLVYDANGTYDSLANGETAEVEVSYTVVDSEGASSTSTVTLTVTGTNDGPVAVADTAVTDQDTSVTVDVIANDTDADTGDTLTLNNVSISTGTGLVSIVDNKLVYDSNGTYDSLTNGETAEVEVSYTVVDSEGASSTSTVTLTVTGTNDGPVAVADTAVTDQDTSVTVDVIANDTDADAGDLLTLNNVSISTGTGLVSIVDNKLVYDANGTYDSLANGETAEVVVSYSVVDSEGVSSTSTATITVTGTNDGPIAVADTAATDQNTSVTVDVIANDTDADAGDTLTLNNVSISTGTGLVSIVDNKLVYDANGTYDSLANGETAEVVVSYTVIDSEGASSTSTATITVTGTNDGPVAVADTSTTDQDTTVTVDVLANDVDPDAGDTLTLSNVSINSGTGLVSIVDNKLVYDPNGTYDSLANGESVDVEVSYTAVDSEGVSTSSTATITVTGTNQAPAASDDIATTKFDADITIDVLVNDSDTDSSDTLTIQNPVVASGQGTVSIVDNKLVYSPDNQYDSLRPEESAEVTITYEISDGQGGTDTATVNVTVEGWHDIVNGTAGDDTIVNLSGRTRIYAGAGEDTINYAVGDGYDHIEGGANTDTLNIDVTAGANVLIEDAATYNARTGASMEADLILLSIDGNIAAEITEIEHLILSADDSNSITINADLSLSHLAQDAITINAIVSDPNINASGLVSNHEIIFHGTSGDTVTIGGLGNDTLYGGGDGDTISGGAGDDLIDGQAGDDIIHGDAGADTFVYTIGEGFDVIDGGTETDTLQIESSGFQIILVETAFVYNLRTGETIDSDHFIVSVNGVPKVDGVNIENIEIHTGPDDHIVLVGDFTTTTLTSDIQIIGNSSDITVDASQLISDHQLVVTGDTGSENVTGSANNDIIVTGDGSDIIAALDGDDTINAGAGADTIYYAMGQGMDIISGDSDIDTVVVDAIGATDVLIEDAASYLLRTGESTANGDFILSIDGSPSLWGISLEALQLTVSASTLTTLSGDLTAAGLPNDFLTVDVYGGGAAQLNVASLTATINPVNATNEGFIMIGGADADTIVGSVDADQITGGLGDDIINTGGGADQIFYTIGQGTDTIICPDGAASLIVDAIGATSVMIEDAASYLLRTGETLTGGQFALIIDGDVAVIGNSLDAIDLTLSSSTTTLLSGNLTAAGLPDDFLNITVDGGGAATLNVASLSVGINPTNTNGDGFVILGGADADTIIGSVDADEITGGLGDDLITTAGGADTIYYSIGEGTDTILSSDGAASLVMNAIGASNVLIEDAASYLVRTGEVLDSGNFGISIDGDLVIISDTLDLIDLTVSNTTLTTLSGDLTAAGLPSDFLNVTVDGGGAAQLNVASLTATINPVNATNEGFIMIGGADADTIVGSVDADQITGGLGDDIINTGGGADQIFYTIGQGTDTIICPDGAASLIVDAIGATSVMIEDAASYLLRTGETLTGGQFALIIDGDVAVIGNSLDAIDLTLSSSTTTLLSGNLTAAGLPDDFLNITVDGGGAATLNVASLSVGINPTNTNGDGFVILGGADADTIIGSVDADEITGGLGDDLITTAGGADTIYYSIGEGTDTILSSDGAASLVMNAIGASNVLIEDAASYLVRTGEVLDSGNFGISIDGDLVIISDTLDLIDLSVSNTTLTTLSGDLTAAGLPSDFLNVTVDGGGAAQLNVASLTATINPVNATNEGFIMIGGADADTIVGSVDADQITGGLGDDIINTGGGADQIFYTIGQGTDTIICPDGAASLIVDAIGATSVMIEDAASYLLRTGETLTGGQFALIIDGDVAVIGNSLDAIDLTLSSSTTTLLSGNLTAAGLPDDFLNITVDGGGAATLNVASLSVGINPTNTNGDGFVILGGADADTIIGSVDADEITGGLGDDLITTAGGADTIYYSIGEGTDTILSSDGAASLVMNAIGASNVLIEDAASYLVRTGEVLDSGNFGISIDGDLVIISDTLDLIDLTVSNTTLTTLSGDLTAAGLPSDFLNVTVDGGGAAQLNVASLTATINPVNATNEGFIMIGGADADTIVGSVDADQITGGLGDDIINTGGGADQIFYTIGQGTDTIICPDGAASLIVDAIGATSVMIEDAASYLLRTGETLTGGQFALIIDGDVAVIGNSLDAIDLTLSSSTTTLLSGNLTAAGLPDDFLNVTVDGGGAATLDVSSLNATITPTNIGNGGFIILGGADADTIQGSIDADDIQAGAGNDLINAGAGDDIIRYVEGDGTDTVLAGPGNDNLILDAATATSVMIEDAASFTSRTGEAVTNGDLVITIDGDVAIYGEEISLLDLTVGAATNTILSGDLSVAGVEIAGISIGVDGGGVPQVDVSLLASSHVLSNPTGEGFIFLGDLLGQDNITGSSGNDLFTTGLGDDTVFGGAGDDNYLFALGEGSDVFDGGEGWDTITLANLQTTISNITVNGVDYTPAPLDLFGYAEFTPDVNGDISGVIELIDGSKVTFDNVERIDWLL